MKQLILIIIKLYWISIPNKSRRHCLFKETCSQFVYRQANELGFFGGIKAFLLRFKRCRKGYHIYTTDKGFVMKLIDGTIVYEEDISPNILNPIYIEIESKTKIIVEKYKPSK